MNPSPLDIATVTLNPAIDRALTISNFAAGAVHRVEAEEDTPGGKGVNVASALADCGFRVGAAGFLGRENAATFEALFKRKNIEGRFVRIAGRTRAGIKITDPVRKLTTDINFPGPAPSPADLDALRDTLAGMQSKWWVVAGSIPPGLDTGICREIVTALKQRGARVVLDASGDPLREALEAAPHVVKPNVAELEALLGQRLAGTDAIIGAARRLLAKGVALAAVSMGREGACFVTATETVIARPPDVEVGSTVGAGDAMVAGIVAAQLRGLPLDETARLASAFSLHLLTRGRSDPFAKAALDAAMKRITIERRGPMNIIP